MKKLSINENESFLHEYSLYSNLGEIFNKYHDSFCIHTEKFDFPLFKLYGTYSASILKFVEYQNNLVTN